MAPTSGRGFAKGVKAKIRDLDGNECWYCGSNKNVMAHVYPQNPINNYDRLRARNLLGSSDVNDYMNGVPLCPLCHDAYDNLNSPEMTFYPTDVTFFIDFERDNFAMRQQGRQISGTWPPRACSTAKSYKDHMVQTQRISSNASGGLYQRCLIEFYFSPGMPFTEGTSSFAPKSWHGDPMAALNRTFIALVNGQHRFPHDVVTQLNDLNRLYGDHDGETAISHNISPPRTVAPPPSDPGTSDNRAKRRYHPNLGGDGACDIPDNEAATSLTSRLSASHIATAAWQLTYAQRLTSKKPKRGWMHGPDSTSMEKAESYVGSSRGGVEIPEDEDGGESEEESWDGKDYVSAWMTKASP